MVFEFVLVLIVYQLVDSVQCKCCGGECGNFCWFCFVEVQDDEFVCEGEECDQYDCVDLEDFEVVFGCNKKGVFEFECDYYGEDYVEYYLEGGVIESVECFQN